MSGKIFISYRRSDTKGYAHVIATPLKNHFGEDQVFIDVDDIELGKDFVEVLEQAVSSCDVLLAMIGPGWLSASDDLSGEHRLDNPSDFVRIEISTALKRNIRVIPVLVQGAMMPAEDELPDVLKPLSRRQAFFISDRPDQDIEYHLLPALQRALNEALSERQSQETRKESKENEVRDFQTVKGYAYVISPLGQRDVRDGNRIDFDQVYQQVIKPAIQKTGFTPVRADEEALFYDISAEDQIQYLLLSDIVIADISVHDAETYYQLGLRHALRKKGVVHIHSSKKNAPLKSMDIPTVTYFIGNGGLPDPKEIDTDIGKISRAILKAAGTDEYYMQSPVFDLLDELKEAGIESLRTPRAQGYWRDYDLWKEKATILQRQKSVGGLLMLVEEIINPLIKEEVIVESVDALRRMGKMELALDLCRQGLHLNPKNLDLLRDESFILHRIGRVDEAIVILETLLKEFPNDSEALATLAKIYKGLWSDRWMHIKKKEDRIAEAFQAVHWLVRTIDIYLNAYKNDVNNYFPGINAVTLAIPSPFFGISSRYL